MYGKLRKINECIYITFSGCPTITYYIKSELNEKSPKRIKQSQIVKNQEEAIKACKEKFNLKYKHITWC